MDRVLDKLTVAEFTGQVGRTFRITGADSPALDLVLVEARDLSLRTKAPGPGRVPFSLVFLGPKGPVLAQSIYPLENETLGRLEIFIVPIGADADGVKYEAIFN
jgi:hypothetical protein